MRSAIQLKAAINPLLLSDLGSFGNWSRAYSGNPPQSSATTTRLEELRARLREESRENNRSSHVFEISERGKNFLKDINLNHLNKKYSRGGKNGEGYVGIDEILDLVSDGYYENSEKERLRQSSSEIQDRMRVKVSEAYIKHALNVPRLAKKPNPILKIVMPDSEEVSDLSGEVDPSNQNRYSPLPGLLHKYEMLLAFTSVNCSSHCRYCYRLDLFNGTSSKSKADMPVIAAYIKTFNSLIDEAIESYGVRDEKSGLWIHKETHEPLIHVREILFSGGDPMTLPNATIARNMALIAEAGINTIRVGTKELVFNPSRFDADFWKTMDLFHETYPEVRMEIVGHYTHPYELVEPKVDNDGEYLYDIRARHQIRKDIRSPLNEIKQRDWLGHYNQFPIIAGVNDSPEVLRLLMYQSNRLGIGMHNIYACREISGNKHFRADNTIESQYELIEQSKSGLSGIENHARLIMSTEYGKVEVCAVEDGNILLKLNRHIHGQKTEKTLIRINKSDLPNDKKFYWLTEEVIDKAVSSSGKEILEELRNEGNSLIKQLKKIAAQRVLCDLPQNDNTQPSNCGQTINIEVVNRNGGSKIIEVNLADKKYKAKALTLATVLTESEDIEAVCKEQLSCSTCIGEIKSDGKLPKVSEDESDVLDSATKGVPSSTVRLSCQIPLKLGQNYKFTQV
jgi:L-lysine 2,3-aminomutase/ferredoxin